VRDVAQDAGVDPALVHYYFNTKDGLFVAAMELPFRPAEVLGPLIAEGVDGLGERMVRRLLGVWDEPAHRTALLTLLGAGGTAALREFITQEIVGRVAGALGDDRAALRANLVASQVMGLIAARYVARLEPLASLPADEVVFVPTVPLRVTERRVDLGDAPHGPLLTVTDSDVVVDGLVPVEQAGRVRTGAKVLVEEPALGIDTVHFGVVIVVNMMIGLITPPYGEMLFLISGVTGIPLHAMLREIWPFLGALFFALLVMSLWPDMVLLLPRLFGYEG